MSNKGPVKWPSVGFNFSGIFLAATMLYLSVQMTKFGILHFPIDVSELSSAEQVRAQRKQFVAHCNDWKSEFGYRLICRKAIADNFFANEFREIADPKAQQVLDDVIKISAMEPAYYVMRGRLGLYNFESYDNTLQFLRLSYLTGRAEQLVMFERFQIAMAIWSLLDQTDKSVALNDVLKNYSSKQEELFQRILSGQIIIDDILPLVKLRAPEIYNRFVQEMAAKQ